MLKRDRFRYYGHDRRLKKKERFETRDAGQPDVPGTGRIRLSGSNLSLNTPVVSANVETRVIIPYDAFLTSTFNRASL